MRRGRPKKPLISLESVSTALKSLDYTAQSIPEINALETLQLIDFRLESNARPSAENIRQWMLQKILVEMITKQLNNHRSYFDLEPVSVSRSRTHVEKQLQSEILTNSEHLLGWRAIYLRYVRPELAFTRQELAGLLAINVRTLRRYQQNTLMHLRDLLIDAEWQAQSIRHTAHLKAQIPAPHRELIGRETEFDLVVKNFSQHIPLPVFIQGNDGIGKTALVTSVVHHLIDHFPLDHIVWIQDPQSTSDITNEIWNKILPYSTTVDWREVLHHQEVCIVVDGADNIDFSADDFTELYLSVQNAFLIITGRNQTRLPSSDLQVNLSLLSETHAQQLIRTYTNTTWDDDLLQTVIHMTGGNPRELILSIHYLRNNEETDSTEITTSLSEWILGTYPATEIAFTCYLVLFKPIVDNSSLKAILSQSVNSGIGNLSALQNVSDDFLIAEYANNPDVQRAVNENIEKLLMIDSESSVVDAMKLVIIKSEWIKIDASLRQTLFETINLDNLSTAQINQFYSAFERFYGTTDIFGDDLLLIVLQVGCALHRLRQYQDAEVYLQKIIEIAGLRGVFRLQQRAMYHYALTLMARSLFDHAREVLQHLLRLRNATANDDIEINCRHQLARIAIAQGHGDDALEFLHELPMDNFKTFTLFSEVQLLKDNFSFITNTFPNYIASHELTMAEQATLYTIWGRSLLASGDTSYALVCMNDALFATERDGNLFDISRAQNNLAGTYFARIETEPLDVLQDIEATLEHTSRIQHQIQDFVGYEATTRNLKLIRQTIIQRQLG